MSKTDPKNEISKFFAHAILEKLLKKIENLRVDYLPEKSKILENFFFHCNQRKIVNPGSPPKKVFDP